MDVLVDSCRNDVAAIPNLTDLLNAKPQPQLLVDAAPRRALHFDLASFSLVRSPGAALSVFGGYLHHGVDMQRLSRLGSENFGPRGARKAFRITRRPELRCRSVSVSMAHDG